MALNNIGLITKAVLKPVIYEWRVYYMSRVVKLRRSSEAVLGGPDDPRFLHGFLCASYFIILTYCTEIKVLLILWERQLSAWYLKLYLML